MDTVYYLYDGFVDEDIVKICLAMNKEIYGVRTKCDPDDDEEENQELKVKDTKCFIKAGLKKPVIFFTSKKGAKDNESLLKHILGK